MITRIVKLSVSPEKIAEFMNYFDQSSWQIRSFKGCSHLDLLGDISGNGVVFTYSIWENKSYLEEYLNSPLFKSTWSKVKPLFFAKAEAWSLEKLRETSPE